jgi:hypothetical protein
VLDNRRRKAVATIGEQGHAEMLSYPPLRLTRFRDDALVGATVSCGSVAG